MMLDAGNLAFADFQIVALMRLPSLKDDGLRAQMRHARGEDETGDDGDVVVKHGGQNWCQSCSEALDAS